MSGLHVNTKYQDGSTVPEVTSKVLQTLWPLLDSFAAELIEGETQDYYGHYHGEKEPLKEMTDAIPHLSGWRVTNGTFPVEPDAEEVAEFDDSTRKLFVRLGVLGSADAHITLEPRWTTSVPPKTDEVHLFGIRRFAHRLKRLYRGFSVLFAQSESARLRKYEQMLQLLQSPLAELSRSIGTMQSETQELRAVLYDPAQTIFASSFVLRELFDERSVIEVSPSIRFITAHEPLRYSNKTKRFAQDRKQAGELGT